MPSNAQEHRAPSNAALPWNTGGSGVVLMKTRLCSSSSARLPGPCGLHATHEMQGAHDGMRVAWMRVACMRAIGCGWLACKPPACRMQCACQPVKDIRVVRLRDTGTWPIRLQCQLGYTACTSTCTPLSAPASP